VYTHKFPDKKVYHGTKPWNWKTVNLMVLQPYTKKKSFMNNPEAYVYFYESYNVLYYNTTATEGVFTQQNTSSFFALQIYLC